MSLLPLLSPLRRVPCAALCLLGLAGACAQAATMTAEVSPAGPSWQAQLTVINDGAPAQIGHFTLYFDEALFSGLALLQSPAGWDSAVVQPDTAIPAPGFLDAVVLASTPPLALGQQQGGFTMQFAYSGIGVPASLRYEIVDDNFNVLFQGLTVAVPEPAGWQFGLLGGAALLGWRRTRPAGARRQPASRPAGAAP